MFLYCKIAVHISCTGSFARLDYSTLLRPSIAGCSYWTISKIRGEKAGLYWHPESKCFLRYLMYKSLGSCFVSWYLFVLLLHSFL